MSKYFCNPINFTYKYQFNGFGNNFSLNREAADPSLVLFKGEYYLFPSMTKGFLVSKDLVEWTMFPLNHLPVYDYAPDVRVVGDYLYFCASKRNQICDFYRTKDPKSDTFECIKGSFDFWDPNLFLDDDGRLYFYWGCSNMTPIYGVELDRVTMKKIGDPVSLIINHKDQFGYERIGEDHHLSGKENNAINIIKLEASEILKCKVEDITDIDEVLKKLPHDKEMLFRSMLSDNPYIEGAWMTKYKGKYYLQYAAPAAEFNVYSDSCYVSDKPLGPFRPARNNPFSYSPGGFCPGAGHGSTMEDVYGNWWHTSTMRISVHHDMERRVGIWPCGFDKDDELFCNQRYGDWPIRVDSNKVNDVWREPDWMLLSFNKETSASSEEKDASNAVDENVKTWWKAAKYSNNEWLKIDLGKTVTVNAVQINFADDVDDVKIPENADLFTDFPNHRRYIDDRSFRTRWILEGSVNNNDWFVVEDKSNADTDLPHDLVVIEEGKMMRYVKLTVIDMPYGQKACVSGLRVFGKDENGEKPSKVEDLKVQRTDQLTMFVQWKCKNAVGFEVLWGNHPDKLYHNYRVFGKNNREIGALVAGTHYYVRVDAFNETGITHGDVIEVKD